MIESRSKINYNYITIKLTDSRIRKGLIAIPRSLLNWFPDKSTSVHIYLDDSDISENKKYTSLSDSSTRESRIGGMKKWFEKHRMKEGEQAVIQLIDSTNFIYRIIPEDYFVLNVEKLQSEFDNSQNEEESVEKITKLSKWTDVSRSEVIINEYCRLIEKMSVQKRQYISKNVTQAENIPNNIRVLLEGIYQGRCQICDFTFLKKDNRPYFEIHHIDPMQGNYPKNLLVVCANCHRQFTYARLNQDFSQDGWLMRVFFNDSSYSVNQIVFKSSFKEFKKRLYI